MRVPFGSAASAWTLRDCAGDCFLAVLIAPRRDCVGGYQNHISDALSSQNTGVLGGETARKDTT